MNVSRNHPTAIRYARPLSAMARDDHVVNGAIAAPPAFEKGQAITGFQAYAGFLST